MTGARDESAGRRDTGRPEQRVAFLDGAVAHVLEHGVATLSLRPLAAALGTSDRMLLYYFGSRERLLTDVLAVVGEQLQEHLSAHLSPAALPPGELLQRADDALREPAAEAHLRLYVEVVGLAARGQEPFRSVATTVAEAWSGWVAARLDVPETERAAAAAGVLATLDGLLLLRFLVSDDRAREASRWVREQFGTSRS